jgi:hypothetical protein
MLWNTHELVVALTVLGVFMLAIEAGFRLGYRKHAEAGQSDKDHISALQAALLGLMGFLLAFTLAMSVGRFDTRKALAIQESNAISTTYLRVQLLPEAQQREIQQLLHTYVDAWRASHAGEAETAHLDEAIASTVSLQQQLWTAAGALAEQNAHSAPTQLFVYSLNEMIDLHEKHLRALENHVPEIMFWMVCAIGVIAFGFVGYRSSLDGRRRFLSTASVALVITLVLTVIVDLDRPRHGLITIDSQSIASMRRISDMTDHVAATIK